jgi:hypothetical protein
MAPWHPQGKRLMQRLWSRWKRVGHAIADVQSRVLLTVTYFTVIAPFGLAIRAAADPLAIKSGTPRGWRLRPAETPGDVRRARQQF